MRLGIGGGVHAAHPIGHTLPGLYQEDPFTQRLTSAFDQALLPVFLAIDNLPAYLDPALTPEDFLEWLAGWVGLVLDETWPIERRRAFVAMASLLYRERGTARGLADLVRNLHGRAGDGRGERWCGLVPRQRRGIPRHAGLQRPGTGGDR